MTPAELRARVAEKIDMWTQTIEAERRRLREGAVDFNLINDVRARVRGFESVVVSFQSLLSEYDASARGDRT